MLQNVKYILYFINMTFRFSVLFFLIACIGIPGEVVCDSAGAQGSIEISEEDDVKAVLDAFNESVGNEAKKKFEAAEKANQEGRMQESYLLMRQAIMLDALKVEEGTISDEKILSLKDQMSSDEKKNWIKRFNQEGNRLAGLGFYDLAEDEYEKVFLLDPENRTASQNIDRLKRKFIKEQKQELDEQGKLIDQRINERVEIYINQAEELIQVQDYQAAKRTLERLLTLKPKNKKAKKMLKAIKHQLEATN